MSRKKKRKKKYRGFWRFVRIQIFFMILVIGGVGYYYFGGYGKQVSSMKAEAEQYVSASNADTFKQNQTSIVYDASGNVISKLKTEKDVYYLTYEEIPSDVVTAMVSIEDKKFYKHHGVDYKAIIRAGLAMIKNGEVTQGASTITQQLARTVFLTQEKTWQRKVEEIFVATALEKKYTKNQIMEFYLNNIYFGNGYYGIQSASRGYFNTDVSNLDLSQIAFLCAIPNNPTYYDPLTNMEHTISRRDRILKNMYEDEKISVGAYSLAKAEDITLNQPEETQKSDYIETFAYYCAIRALMQQQGFQFQYTFDSDAAKDAYDNTYSEAYSECQQLLYTGGYQVYTSLDTNLQSQLQSAIDTNLAEFTTVSEDGVYELQSAGVCIDNHTGYVKAVVGGRTQDFTGYTLNRAYQSYRQPGSAIKPLIVYTPSLENGYTPDSIVVDEPIEDGPSNAGGSYSGSMTLREAVERSKNTIAWKLFDELTPEVGLSYLEAMNFSKLDAEDVRLPAALGGFTNGVSPLEMASGYAAIENDGNYREPTCIIQILDASGNAVYVSGQEEKEVYKENAARMMTNILEGVITEGTGAGLGLGDMPCAGKTGTTNDNKDGWFVGYTSYYTTSIWVGYDMPQELPGLTGSSYPGSIWQTFMLSAHEGLTPTDFLPYAGETTTDSTSTEQPTAEETPQEVPQEVPAETTDPNAAGTGDAAAGDSAGTDVTTPAPGTESTDGTGDNAGTGDSADTTDSVGTTDTEGSTTDGTGTADGTADDNSNANGTTGDTTDQDGSNTNTGADDQQGGSSDAGNTDAGDDTNGDTTGEDTGSQDDSVMTDDNGNEVVFETTD